MTPQERDTIYALSSGAPPSAIGIVRVSGPGAGIALSALAGGLPNPRKAVLRRLVDPVSGGILDHGLILWFPGPATATGEDLAELQLHGGRAVVAATLACLSRIDGLRSATPGEFTRRAFANGVIDLAEAEGLGDLLASETEAQRRSALALADGVLSRRAEDWRSRLVGMSARLEAMIDFSDEDDVSVDADEIGQAVVRIMGEMRQTLAYPPAERLRDGIRVVLAGPPNAGKSTLFNALAGRDAAIVTDIAGTTRDLIEAPVAIAGIPVILIDTAGLRDAADAVERIGIGRAAQALAAADIVLWLGASDEALETQADVIRLAAQSDRNPPRPSCDFPVSALTGAGMERLHDELQRRLKALMPGETEFAINERQRSAIRDAVDGLTLADGADDVLLLAEGLRLARVSLDRLTGRAGIEDVLDSLFEKFCIGK